MEQRFTLKQDPAPIQLEAGLTLVAPGLVGTGVVATGDPGTKSLRAFSGDKRELERALGEAGADLRYSVRIDAPTPDSPAGARRAGALLASNEVLLQVPLRADERAYLIYTDESGRASFHYRDTASSALPTRAARAARQDQFRIELRAARSSPGGAGDKRAMFSKAVSKIIRVIIVKVIPDAAGDAVARLVRAWEERARPHHGFHGGRSAAELFSETPVSCSLEALREQKSLLFVHGTTSSTANAFGKMRDSCPEALDRLYRHYEGRVIGFNHHTMSVGVRQNVEELHEALAKAPGEYRFDVVCHSRGGLVARGLTALRKPASGVRLHIDRIIFVATPNSGTDLAIPDRIPAFVERLTNYVNMLPDSTGVIAVGALLSIAGSLVEAGLPKLPGLADQAPESGLLKALAAAGQGAGKHAAFQADYTAKGNLAAVVVDNVVDRIFGETKNDIVVPTEGVSSGLRIDPDRVVRFGVNDGVHHTNFFGNRGIAKIADFLGA